MIKIIFVLFISLFLFLLLIKISNSQQVTPEQKICIDNISDKFGLSYYNDNGVCDNVGTFCNNGVFTEVIIFPMALDVLKPATLIISDIECFPNLTRLEVQTISVDPELMYYQTEYLTDLTLLKVGGDFSVGITKSIPAKSNFYLETTMGNTFSSTNLLLSNINNINSVTLMDGPINLGYDIIGLVNITNLQIKISNIPSFSNSQFSLKQLALTIDDSFNILSTSNIENFNTANLEITKSGVIPLPFYYFSKSVVFLSHSGPLLSPTTIIDLTDYTNLTYVGYVDTGSNFSINGELAIKFPKTTTFQLWGVNITNLPSLDLVGPGQGLILRYNGITQEFPFKYNSSGYYYDFTGNFLTGTIDESFCNTQIIVTDNKMSGTIPSCYTCYFAGGSNGNNNPAGDMLYRFNGNNFLPAPLECTTFAPQVKLINSTTIKVYGKDLSYEPLDDWLIDGSTKFKTITPIKYSEEYDCTFGGTAGLDYISINFVYPGNRHYTFSLIQHTPIPSSVIVNENNFTIDGSYFSTYLGQSEMTIDIDGVNCILQSSSFYQINCYVTKSLFSSNSNDSKLITISNESMVKKAYIQTYDGAINNLPCPNDCTSPEYGLCDLSNGICNCNSNWTGPDCLFAIQYVSSVVPSSSIGGLAVFNGFFGDVNNNLTISIGDLNCPLISVSFNEIKCTSPPNVGIKSVNISQNGINYIGSSIYQYIDPIKGSSCPNDCIDSKHGECNLKSGECICNSQYGSYDCGINKDIDIGIDIGQTITVDPILGTVTFTKGSNINFIIEFQKLLEIDYNGIILNEYILENNWSNNQTIIGQDTNIYSFSQVLVNTNCIITSKIEEIKNENGKEYTFGNINFNVEKDNIKFSISVSNYPYKSSLSTLQLIFNSYVKNIDSKDQDDCNEETDTELYTDQYGNESNYYFNFIKIIKNNRIFSGKFINRVVSDGKPTFFSSTTNITSSDSVQIKANLPHCVISCEIDPDFGLLLGEDYKKCESQDRRKWVLPVAIIVPFVVVCAISIVIYVKYNTSTNFKIKIYKLKSISSKSLMKHK